MKNVYKAMPTGMKICSGVAAVYCLISIIAALFLLLCIVLPSLNASIFCGRCGYFLSIAASLNPMGLIASVIIIDDAIRMKAVSERKYFITTGVLMVVAVTAFWVLGVYTFFQYI